MTYTTHTTYNSAARSLYHGAHAAVTRYVEHYVASYHGAVARSYHVRLFEAGDSDGGRRKLAVSFTLDFLLRGFWKESGTRVEFVPHDSPQGQRVAEAWGLLGIPVPGRCSSSFHERKW